MELFPTILRVVASLAAVLTLVWLLGRFARRRGLGGSLTAEHFAVLGRQPLSRTASIALVRVGGTALVVGVAEGSVRLLGSAPLSDVMAPEHVDLTALTLPGSLSPSATPHSIPSSPASRAHDADPAPFPPASSAGDAGGEASGGQGAGWGASSGRTGRRAARTLEHPSALAGSALSPATWTRAVDVLRERTTRR